jgi:hypothetical protein
MQFRGDVTKELVTKRRKQHEIEVTRPCSCAFCAFLWLTLLFPPPVRGRSQFLNFCFQIHNFLLLFLDRVKHRLDDRIVVYHQIAGRVLGHRFRNDLLESPSPRTDVFSF